MKSSAIVTKRAVLILGASPRVAVPMARCLKRACGVPVDVAALFDSDPVLQSRSIRNFVRLPDYASSPVNFSSALLRVLRDNNIDTVFAVQDRGLAAMAANYAVLSDSFHLGCPSPEVVERALDKTKTLRIAEQCGIRIPRTCAISSGTEAQSLVKGLRFPIVLKPAETKHTARFKTASFRTAEELLEWVDNHGNESELLAQEYCEGVGVGVEVLLNDGQLVAAFQHRRLKEQPPWGGVAVTAVAEKPDPALLESSLQLLRAMKWNGVAMVEFRCNPQTGEAVLMEVNGRFWGTTALPLMAGVEFPVYYWQMLHGKKPDTPRDYTPGLRWRWTAGYLGRTRQVLTLNRQEARGISLWRELASIPGDFAPGVKDAVFTMSDPLPGVLEPVGTLAHLLKSTCTTLIKRSRQRFRSWRIRISGAVKA